MSLKLMLILYHFVLHFPQRGESFMYKTYPESNFRTSPIYYLPKAGTAKIWSHLFVNSGLVITNVGLHTAWTNLGNMHNSNPRSIQKSEIENSTMADHVFYFPQSGNYSTSFLPCDAIPGPPAFDAVFAKHRTVVTRTTRTPAFWGYPSPPHDYPYYWVILDP